jgi:hypothetical protein
MPYKKLLGALMLGAFIVQAGLLGAPRDAKAYSLSIAAYNDSGQNFSAAHDVKVIGNKALLKIVNTPSLKGSGGEPAVGPVLLDEDFADWFNSSLINDGPGVIFSLGNLGLQPLRQVSLPNPGKPWSATLLAASTHASAPRNGIDPQEMRTLTLLFKAGHAGVTDEQLALMISNTHGEIRLDAQGKTCGAEANCAFTTVPIPGSIWLFATALLGLMGVGYRRKIAATA